MNEQDWQALAAALETATSDYSREELIALLRDLISEYIVPQGLPTGEPNAAATPDVGAMNFPDLIRWLKRSSNAPELQRFSVDGQRVVVDLDGPRVLSGARDEPYGAANTPGAPGITMQEGPVRRPQPAPAPTPPAIGPRGVTPRLSRPRSGVQPAPPLPPAQEPGPGGDGGDGGRALPKGFRGLEFD